MTLVAKLALFGWIPFTAFLFWLLPTRRAVLVSLLGGLLFLPRGGIPITGFPDFTNISSISLGTLTMAVIMDSRQVATFRARWIDLPMALWCAWPLLTVLSVGMAPYDGISASINLITMWGIPYFLGRVYFTDRHALRELVVAIAVAGMIYVPLCLYEIRMSPSLHTMVYGYAQKTLSDGTRRFGGWRPMVFLTHGLALGMFMATASLCAIGLWLDRYPRRILFLAAGACTVLLVATTVLCKSVGAIALMFIGAGALVLTRRGMRSWPVLLLLIFVPLYITGRITGTVATGPVADAARSLFGEERSESLRFRMNSEDALLVRFKSKLWLGYGPSGAYLGETDSANLVEAVDGMWMIIFGRYGLAGLVVFLASLALPAVLAMRARGSRLAGHGPGLSVCVLSLLLTLYLMDSILNAMPSSLYPLISGALGCASAAHLGRVQGTVEGGTASSCGEGSDRSR